jgi:hypothetical integral membrane protein (TIGR02206 family)
MRQFSIAHLAALATLAVAGGLAIFGPRHHPGPWVGWASRAVAAVILAGWVGENVAEVAVGTWTLRYSLPLQLTSAVSLVAVIALLTRRLAFVEVIYFWAFSASLQAALTPDLGSTFPNVFYFTYFLYHVGAIVAACALVFGCRLYPRRGAVWRVYLLTLAFTAVAALADVVTGGNYMYLRSKPTHSSLLNEMGPWPLYIVSGAALGLVMFVALNAIASAAARRDVVQTRSRTG